MTVLSVKPETLVRIESLNAAYDAEMQQAVQAQRLRERKQRRVQIECVNELQDAHAEAEGQTRYQAQPHARYRWDVIDTHTPSTYVDGEMVGTFYGEHCEMYARMFSAVMNAVHESTAPTQPPPQAGEEPVVWWEMHG